MAQFTGTIQHDDGSIKNRHYSNQAADILDADKVQHVYKAGTCLGFAVGATPTTREEIIWVADGAGTIRGFHCLLNDTGTSTDVDFDLQKNGTTVLSAVATVTHSESDGEVVDGTLSVTTFVAGDIFSIAMTVNSSTGAQGPYAWADLEENAP